MNDNLRDSALRQAAACAREKYAGQEPRLERGLLLALNYAVEFQQDGTALVRSDRDPEVFYRVSSGVCDCPDWNNAPDHNCKHRFAVFLLRLYCAALKR